MAPCRAAEPEAEVDAASEAAGRHEGEPPHAPISLEQQPLGDAAAERVADEIEVVDPERVEPGADHLGVPGERVARVGSTREAVPGEVGRDHPPRPGELGRSEAPRRARVSEPVKQDERPTLPERPVMQVDVADANERGRSSEEHARHCDTL